MNRDFAEMLSELSAAGADYIVVGGYAVIAHGFPRATGDIDVWVRPSQDNATRVMLALRRFGAPLADLTEGDLSTPGVIFQIGVVPTRIDILTEIDGVTFEEAWTSRISVTLGEQTIPVLGRWALLRNKKASGRKKDLIDVAWLEENDGPSDATG